MKALPRGVAALAIAASATAQAAPLMVSDYGAPGLLQTPSARFGEDGDFAIGIVHNKPYDRFFFTLAPLSWLEASFRYTDVTNRLYSPVESFSGDQSYKDRSLDVRAQLFKEGPWMPSVALGFRDLGGTQLFGAQYLVANRRYYNFDVSLGLGWGRLGAGGPIANPFAREVSEDTRTPGNVGVSRLFTSKDIGIFGGVVWTTPLPGLEALLEYDANNFKNEPLDNPQDVHFPLNLGLRYYYQPAGVQLGLSYERGETLSFTLALLTNFGKGSGFPKVLDPLPTPLARAPVAPAAAAPASAAAPAEDATAKAVRTAFREQKIGIEGYTLSDDGRTASLTIGSGPYRDSRKTLGRAARAAAATLPPSVASLKITESLGGVPLYTATVNRKAVADAATGRISSSEIEQSLRIVPADNPADPVVKLRKSERGAGWSINPALRSQVGGPDGFFIGQLWLRVGGYAQLADGLSVNAEYGLSLIDNFDQLKLESDSQLPRVRSDIVKYLREGRSALVKLESNYVKQLAPTLYGRVSAGIFEEMYGGVATELLWRPADPRFALGVNVNRVRQRDFDQLFRFRDYEVTTGNLTGYFEYPKPSVLVKLSVGQYLAGDRGATLDISREFDNGVRVGVFATKTNVSAEQFGEGSFDKGFYFALPFDLFLPSSNRSYGSFAFRPLTRDGGQMVRDGRPLYDLTRDAVTVRMPASEASFLE